MSALDDLREHPVPDEPRWMADPDARSFHEVVCDLARKVLSDLPHHNDLPKDVCEELVKINASVNKIAVYLRRSKEI